MDCSLQGSSVHGIFQARVLEWVAISFSRGSSPPGIEPGYSTLQADALLSEPPNHPRIPCGTKQRLDKLKVSPNFILEHKWNPCSWGWWGERYLLSPSLCHCWLSGHHIPHPDLNTCYPDVSPVCFWALPLHHSLIGHWGFETTPLITGEHWQCLLLIFIPQCQLLLILCTHTMLTPLHISSVIFKWL